MFERYVAVGDSTTEGLNDHDGNGGFRGWADRLAVFVAEASDGLEYANLAVRGRSTRQIKEEQLEPALVMQPDLVSCVAGMNDLLRPRWDPDGLALDIDAMFASFRSIGATVITFTFPPPGPGMPLARLIVPRIERYNGMLRALAKRHDVLLFDLASLPVANDPRLWSDDRLHGNAAGHDRMARGLAYTLGLTDDASFRDDLPPLRRPMQDIVLEDLVWLRTHLGPWVMRHLRGQSSGDGLHPKRPQLLPVEV